jgi:hypothetical protein
MGVPRTLVRSLRRLRRPTLGRLICVSVALHVLAGLAIVAWLGRESSQAPPTVPAPLIVELPGGLRYASREAREAAVDGSPARPTPPAARPAPAPKPPAPPPSSVAAAGPGHRRRRLPAAGSDSVDPARGRAGPGAPAAPPPAEPHPGAPRPAPAPVEPTPPARRRASCGAAAGRARRATVATGGAGRVATRGSPVLLATPKLELPPLPGPAGQGGNQSGGPGPGNRGGTPTPDRVPLDTPDPGTPTISPSSSGGSRTSGRTPRKRPARGSPAGASSGSSCGRTARSGRSRSSAPRE